MDKSNIPVKGVVPLDQMIGGDEEDTKLLRVMASGAENYLRCFPWCKGIRDRYYGDGYGGIVAVFLFRIESSRTDVDEWLWVVFGDVPPAYLVTDSCKTPSQAVEGYMEEIAKWAQLAKEGRSSKDVIPVYVPATPENAADVERRMKFLQEVIVPAFREAEAVHGAPGSRPSFGR
jgi:hypothetical protein